MAAKKWVPAKGDLGRNAKYEINEKGVMTITVDLNIRLNESASGKSIIVASTDGNQTPAGAGGVVFGLNAYVKKNSKQ